MDTNIKSRCCNVNAIESRGKYFCATTKGCGKWCEVYKEVKVNVRKKNIFDEIREIIIEDVPLQYQDRLLTLLKDLT